MCYVGMDVVPEGHPLANAANFILSVAEIKAFIRLRNLFIQRADTSNSKG